MLFAAVIFLYSASLDDKDTACCFLMFQRRAPLSESSLKRYPVDDPLSTGPPFQSAAAYPTSTGSRFFE